MGLICVWNGSETENIRYVTEKGFCCPQYITILESCQKGKATQRVSKLAVVIIKNIRYKLNRLQLGISRCMFEKKFLGTQSTCSQCAGKKTRIDFDLISWNVVDI